MSCEGKPELTAYDRLLSGHAVLRDEAEHSFPGAKGDISAFRIQKRLVETVDGAERFIRLLPKKVVEEQLSADNLR